MTKRELLFSVTRKDCDWQFYRAPGAGGQHKNKKDTACRCIHRESGAVGKCETYRSQSQNKKIAFKRMAESETFKKWHNLECARRLGNAHDIDATVDAQMRQIRVEVMKNSKWTEE